MRFAVLMCVFVLCVGATPKCGGKQKADTLLDVARDFMYKAKNTYPDCVEDEVACGQKEKSLAFLDVAMNMITQIKKDYPVCPDCPNIKCPDPECPDIMCPDPECPDIKCPEPECPKEPLVKFMDCGEILQSGMNKSGVYSIWPRSRISANKSLSVYCDMDTDGGGWTVIQRRGNFSTPKDYFYKNWAEYKIGFGNIKEEFWIGNDNLFDISNQAKYNIRFDLKDHTGKIGYAVYDTFSIEDEAAQYKLHIGGYSGNAKHGMRLHEEMKFSTKDRKNDMRSEPTEPCAVQQRGAWWYNDCGGANLNGLYQPGTVSPASIRWTVWKGDHYGLAWVEMKLRRKI